MRAGHRSRFAAAVRAHLDPVVHAVTIGDDLVFLDVRNDRYLCWPGLSGVPVRMTPDGRALDGVDIGLATDLLAAGLTQLEAADSSFATAPCLPPPRRDLDGLQPAPPTWRDGPDALRCALDCAVSYRRQTFADLVAYGARRRRPPPDAPTPEMLALVQRFQVWAPWLPAPAKCLIRSHTLLRLLRRSGFDARWVFAVRTWPFEAHCWLQVGEVVLDDYCERLVAFHPILVV
jgi:transglutaminase superfamily protein